MSTIDWDKLITPEQKAAKAKADLIAYAAQKRYEREVGGMDWMLGEETVSVHTDRESQAKIIAERLAIAEGRRQDPDGWKFADGVFRMVSNDDFVTLSDAVREHVRQCFGLEAQVLAGIENGDITSEAEIDAAFS